MQYNLTSPRTSIIENYSNLNNEICKRPTTHSLTLLLKGLLKEIYTYSRIVCDYIMRCIIKARCLIKKNYIHDSSIYFYSKKKKKYAQ